MSSFSDILQETGEILNTAGSNLHPSSIERLWELSSWWCASENLPMVSHFLEMIFRKLFQLCSNRIGTFQDRLGQSMQLLPLPQQRVHQFLQNILQLQPNNLQPQQNIQHLQQNAQNNQQLGQDFLVAAGQIQKSLRISQWWWQGVIQVSQISQQNGYGYQLKQILLTVLGLQREYIQKTLQQQLDGLQERLLKQRQQLEKEVETGGQWNRMQPQGNQHLPQQQQQPQQQPQQPHNQQGESRQPVEELLILACQVLTALPEDDTLMSDLVDGIMFADVAGVPIEKAASYLSTEHLNHVITALEAEIFRGDFTLAAETLQKLARERSLQNLNVVTILQAVKGDARRVWSLTELPEPLKELFHIPFQELYKELKQ